MIVIIGFCIMWVAINCKGDGSGDDFTNGGNF